MPDPKPNSKALTTEEHVCAEFMAYFRSLERHRRGIPPYNETAAIRDFTRSAGEITDIVDKYPVGSVDNLYESHPLDDDYDRPVPTALRKYPYLLITQVAVLCFNEIKESFTPTEYWTLLGHIWTANTKDKTHYHHSYTRLYTQLFSSNLEERDSLMTGEELCAYRNLPRELKLFRGCGEPNKAGLSWSLSKKTARGFARDWNSPPWFIVEGTCDKSCALAFFNRDNEQEVIVPNGISVAPATPFFSENRVE